MASWHCQDRRIHRLSRLCLALLLALVVVAVAPLGRVQAGSGTTCFQGMHYANGGAGCDPQASGMFPAPGGLPGPSGPVRWIACVSQATFLSMNARFGWNVPLGDIMQAESSHLSLSADGFTDLQLNGYLPFNFPCPPPAPPPPAGDPLVYLTYDDILAFVPEALWSGAANCPPGDQAGDACPPSVGNAIHIWVATFASARGPTQTCSRILSPFWYFTSYRACLRWRQVGGTTWDFDDETVNGNRVSGQNYAVGESGTGPGSAVGHTFEYPSGFDPLRNCLRPCPGDALGPPLPGHPSGSPAFQVTVSSVWEVQVQQWFSTGGPLTPTAWQPIDLRTLGAPNADFTATSLIAIPVLEYGASPP